MLGSWLRFIRHLFKAFSAYVDTTLLAIIKRISTILSAIQSKHDATSVAEEVRCLVYRLGLRLEFMA